MTVIKFITLKKVKFHEDMSEETNCFSANVYFKNKYVAFCKNDGQGGETIVYRDTNDKELYDQFLEYCSFLGDIDYGNFRIDSTPENVVDYLFDQWLEKD